ncbi:hypothetical protein [Cytobacillus oceanisediminis]|uniref:hypothetical protein n=1 Tax=Cytobacillus oceanisediminis TaxID=665099 RepID=UPI0037352665
MERECFTDLGLAVKTGYLADKSLDLADKLMKLADKSPILADKINKIRSAFEYGLYIV